ncbi:ANTH domain-containing protein [Dichotomocladium elegans]|nr:ANTH domain-containing protein [Dichotomocladium elegans]
MSGIMDTAVRKATRLSYEPPKMKHLNTLNALTYQYPASVGDIVDLLERRVRENSWIVTFKVLLILHTLMREGNDDKVIACIDSRPSALDTSRLREKSSGTAHIQNIYVYSAYLQQKVHAFRELGTDHVKYTVTRKSSKLRRMTVADGLLKETVIVQKQIGALLKCNFLFDKGDNAIGLHAFRLLIEDLLVLFQTVNEAIVNILEHYFEMPKSDARTSLEVYKRFSKQTEQIVNFLGRAKMLEGELNISIPVTRHAPLSLASVLSEYLDDARNDIPAKSSSQEQPHQETRSEVEPIVSKTQQNTHPKELVDFFASLANETVPIALPSHTGCAAHNPFRMTVLSVPTSPSISVASSMSLTPPIPTMNSSVSMTTASVAHHNPFRVIPQQSSSTPTYTADISSSYSLPSVAVSVQHPQQQTQMQQFPFNSTNKFNPFVSSAPDIPAVKSHNPFATF